VGATTLKALGASALVALVSGVGLLLWRAPAGVGLGAEALRVAVPAALGSAAYLLGAHALHLQEMETVTGLEAAPRRPTRA
jgi:hypothetical protein